MIRLHAITAKLLYYFEQHVELGSGKCVSTTAVYESPIVTGDEIFRGAATAGVAWIDDITEDSGKPKYDLSYYKTW